MVEFDPDDILLAFEEVERGGWVDLDDGIRIIEARSDAIIAAQRTIEAKQELVDKSA